MALSILGGKLKGLTLAVPVGDKIRPTSVLLRRKVFDARQNMQDFTFVDACCGSGAMGIEAWSRGAESVHLVEADKKVFKTLSLNVEKVLQSVGHDIQEGTLQIYQERIERWLPRFAKMYLDGDAAKQNSTIIFFDPPYEMTKLYEEVILGVLIGQGWYQGQIWVEADGQKGLPLKFWETKGLPLKFHYTHGSSYVLMLSKQDYRKA